MAILTNAAGAARHRNGEDKDLFADQWGNNAAVECPACHEYPVLLTARPGWRGSGPDRPATCLACRASVWMTSAVGPGLEIPVLRVTFAQVDD